MRAVDRSCGMTRDSGVGAGGGGGRRVVSDTAELVVRGGSV